MAADPPAAICAFATKFTVTVLVMDPAMGLVSRTSRTVCTMRC